MPVDLSIENVPDRVVALLRARAARRHRSLDEELLAIVEEAVRPIGRLTPNEALAETRRIGLRTPAEAAAIVRADRDRRCCAAVSPWSRARWPRRRWPGPR
jgi:plasmid stability protein